MHERKKDEEESLSKDLYLGSGYFAWPQLVSLVHQIIDVHDMKIDQPHELEAKLNNIAGVVDNGIFAFNKPELVLASK